MINERLGTNDYIIQDVLDSLKLPEDEKEVYQGILNKYRYEAYRQYLDTLCSIKTWDKLSSNCLKMKKEDKEKSILIGKFALLLHDIQDWNKYSLSFDDEISKNSQKSLYGKCSDNE